MNTPQHLSSKITPAATGYLCDAAIALDIHRDVEAARTPLVDAVLETLGNDARLREIVDLLLRGMELQRHICRDEIL
jgi:hypothetical protein